MRLSRRREARVSAHPSIIFSDGKLEVSKLAACRGWYHSKAEWKTRLVRLGAPRGQGAAAAAVAVTIRSDMARRGALSWRACARG